jgi:hypothetical protein
VKKILYSILDLAPFRQAGEQWGYHRYWLTSNGFWRQQL